MAAIDINTYLASLKGTTIYYCPNPGNAGDSMIAHATFHLFRRHNIDYRLFNEKKCDLGDKTVMYGGGGGLIPLYRKAETVIRRLHSRAKRFILLPQTIQGEENLLDEFRTNVEIMCREEISYCHVQKHAKKADVMIAEDLALHLDPEIVLRTKTPGFLRTLLLRGVFDLKKRKRRHRFPPLQKTMAMKRFEIEHYLRKVSGPEERSGVLEAFREDVEGVPALMSPHNIDVSKVFSIGTRNEQIALYTTKKFLEFINKFSEVRTNRLHVCIAAALLGKTVKFYPNNYYKCEAVYNYSIKGRFPNVRWMG